MVMTNFTWFSIVAIFSVASISADRVRVTHTGERASQSIKTDSVASAGTVEMKVASNNTSRKSIQGFSELDLHAVGRPGPQKYPTSDDKQGAKCCKRDAPELNGKGGSNGDGEVLMWFWTEGEKLGWGDCPKGWSGAWLSSSCDKYGASLMNTADWDRDTSQRTEDFCGQGIGDPSCADVGCKSHERCCFYMGKTEVDKQVYDKRAGYTKWVKTNEYSPWKFQCTATPCWQTPWLNGIGDPYLSSGYTVSLHKHAQCQGPANLGAMYHRRRGTFINKY